MEISCFGKIIKTTHAFYTDKDEESLDILYNNSCKFSYMYMYVFFRSKKQKFMNAVVDAEVKINEE